MSVIQSTHKSGTGTVVTDALNTGATRTFVVCISAGSGSLPNAAGVTDTFSNTYVQRIDESNGSGQQQRTYDCILGVGGSGHQITANIGDGTIYFVELPRSTLDDSDSNVDTTTPFDSPAIAASAAQTLISIVGGSDGVFTAGNSFTKIEEEIDSGSFWPSALAVRDVTTVTNYNSTFTCTQPGNKCVSILGYIPVAGSTINNVTAEDVTAIVDAYISLLLRLRGQTETTLISEAAGSFMLRNLSVTEVADVPDSFLSRRLSTSMQGESVVSIDSFLSSVAGNTINTVTASDVLIVVDAFVSLLLRMRDQAEITVVSEGGLDISTLYSIFVSESLDIADSLIRRMLSTMLQGEALVFTDSAASSISGQNLITTIASDAVVVAWQALLSSYRNNLSSETATTVDAALGVSLFNILTSSLISSVDESLAQIKRLISIVDSAEVVDSVSAIFMPFTASDGSKVRIGADQPRIQLGGYAP